MTPNKQNFKNETFKIGFTQLRAKIIDRAENETH